MKKQNVSTFTLLSVLGLAAGGAWAQDTGLDQEDNLGQREQQEQLGQDSQDPAEPRTGTEPQFGQQDREQDTPTPQFGQQDRELDTETPQLGQEDEELDTPTPQFGQQDRELDTETPQFGQQDEEQEQSPQVAQQDQQERTPQVQAYTLIEEYDENNDVTLNQEEFTKLYQDKVMSASTGGAGQSESSPGAGLDSEPGVAGGQASGSEDQNTERFQQRFDELDADDNGQVNSTELAEAIPVEEDARNIAGSTESSQDQDREV